VAKSILEIPSKPGNFTGEHRIWSASTLNEIEECPKRFALRRASFPEIWSRAGFPNRISAAQVKGIVVHEVVSMIMNSVQNSSELAEKSVMSFLKERGGYLELLKSILDKELLSANSNPRAELMVEAIKREILADLSELRGQVQYFVKESINKLPAVSSRVENEEINEIPSTAFQILPINSEYKIVDSEFPIEGYLDLLLTNEVIDHIIDYKTSKTIHDEYWDQLSLYAWLWYRSAKNLRKGDCRIEVISGANLSESRVIKIEDLPAIQMSVLDRIKNAELSITGEIAAKPSIDSCKFCAVKVMCNAYWKMNDNQSTEAKWSDMRIRTTGSLGGNAWSVSILSDDTPAMLIVGDRDDGSIEIGQELRLLNAYKNEDQETGVAIRLSQNSEIFRVLAN
jgi:CRISPR/Cas system-associated exonuclease Cas4 (RecB family)